MTRFNRQDVSRRRTPHDLAATRRRSTLSSQIDGCNGCGDCLDTGAVDDCELCPHGGTTIWTAYLPPLTRIISGIPGHATEVELAHASGCTWQSDDIAHLCDEVPATFGWDLQVNGRMPGENTLSLQRVSGSGCGNAVAVYRNLSIWNCLCPNVFAVSRDESDDVSNALLPCTICVRPKAVTCGEWGDLPQVYRFKHVSGVDPVIGLCDDSYRLTWGRGAMCSPVIFGLGWHNFDVGTKTPWTVNCPRHYMLALSCEGNSRGIYNWHVLLTQPNLCIWHQAWDPVDADFDPRVGGLFEARYYSEPPNHVARESVYELMPL